MMDTLPTALFSLHSTSCKCWCVLWWGWGLLIKVAVWNTPEGEVTTYSIRISYYDTFLRQQFLWSENSWIQLHLSDLPSQRPLWIEVLGFLNFTHEWIKCHHVCVLTLSRSEPATLQDLDPGAAELNCVWTRKVSWPGRMLMHLAMHQ